MLFQTWQVDADPETGYQIEVNGQQTVTGGTSAVAPLWAGLIANINQKLGHSVGFINPVLYKLSASEWDIPRYYNWKQ